MNTVEELKDKFNIDSSTSQRMLLGYSKRIGTINGDYEISDIEYIGNGTKKVIEKCTHCGEIYVSYMLNGRNKWSELKKTCECQSKKFQKRKKVDEYIGQKFNRLTVLGFDLEKEKETNHIYAICGCECGNIATYQITGVLNGKVKSCGCLKREIEENSVIKNPLYPTWNGMKQRCFNPNSPEWENYGGRGISVCKEWSNSFDSFLEWSIENGYRPNRGLSIDRIDVNKGYCPENCRWTTVYVQNVNKRKQKPRKGTYEINGVTKTKKEWCEEYGVWDATVDYRMKKMGMTFEEALKAEKRCEGNHQAALNLKFNVKNSEIENLNKCKSYIEANLYMAILRNIPGENVIPQVPIGNYVVDFEVEKRKIIVECDGYDFHKTQEQMNVDCARDRFLSLNGYRVIRFSGKEINNNPDACALELKHIIESIGA